MKVLCLRCDGFSPKFHAALLLTSGQGCGLDLNSQRLCLETYPNIVSNEWDNVLCSVLAVRVSCISQNSVCTNLQQQPQMRRRKVCKIYIEQTSYLERFATRTPLYGLISRVICEETLDIFDVCVVFTAQRI